MTRNTTITHENLVTEFSSGNENALEFLYDHYSGALLSVLLRLTSNEDTSRDLLQDAFVKIWRNRNSYDKSKGTLYTWMLNLTRNLCIDYLRSKRHKNNQKNQKIDNVVYGLESVKSFDPSHIGLNELIEKLPKEQKAVIVYAYFKGYTQQEISEELDIPLGTVKSRVRVALKKLKELF